MKGRVAFWFRIRRQGEEIFSEVLFKLFGQKCSSCNPSLSVDEVTLLFCNFNESHSLIRVKCFFISLNSCLRCGIPMKSKMLSDSFQAKSSLPITEEGR